MCDSESIHHEALGRGSQRHGELRVVAFFSRVETKILQQSHLPGTHTRHSRLNLITGTLGKALDRLLQELCQAAAYRAQP